MFEEPGQTTSTMERTERNKYNIPILSDRDTDLTKINPRVWWEQMSEYIDLTYHKNLEDLMDQGTETMDAHTAYHIKGDLCPPEIPQQSPILQCEARRGGITGQILEKAGGYREEVRVQPDNTRRSYHIQIAATIHDKKAQENFIKGPLELRTVLETIDVDNYNQKFG